MVSFLHFIVTDCILAILEILGVKEWPVLEIWDLGVVQGS